MFKKEHDRFKRWCDTFEMNFSQPYDNEKRGYQFTREMIENTLKYIDTRLKLETDPNTGEMSRHDWIEEMKNIRQIVISDLASLNKQQRDHFHIIM